MAATMPWSESAPPRTQAAAKIISQRTRARMMAYFKWESRVTTLEALIHRRRFLQKAGILPAGLALSLRHSAAAQTGWRTFEVTTRVDVLQPAGVTHIWVPAALVRETPFQQTISNTIECPAGTAHTVTNNAAGLALIAVEFP